MAEPRGNILPFYFVADHSYSMAEEIHRLNEGLTALLEALRIESFAASKVRFGVIGFNNNAQIFLPLSDLRNVEQMPVLEAGFGTSYAAAFRLLAQQIPTDVLAMKAESYIVMRPVVFFLTDGYPDPREDWRQALDELLALRARPHILAFGIGDSDPAIIQQIATSPEYAHQQASGADTGRALTNFISALTQSVVSSGQVVGRTEDQGGPAGLQLEKPSGFIMIETDVI